MANSLILNVVKNSNGTHTISWNANFDGKPWALTISIAYGRKVAAGVPMFGVVSWSSKQNPNTPIPTEAITFDPRTWNTGNSNYVTYLGYVATSEDQTGQDVVEAQAPRITIKL